MSVDCAYELTATQALSLIDAGALTPKDWVRSCRQRILDRDPVVRAFSHVSQSIEGDMEVALAAQAPSIIPVAAKDIIDVVGQPTMMGTDFHDANPVTREGGSVALMREAGCVFLGKTVTTELGHRHPGPTRNPLNLDYTPGGSSSGSAAAVADYMVPVALGTQTSGSVIRPASYCGVVGFKPSYGSFDKTGILANAPTMDTLGLIARSLDDVNIVRGILIQEPAGPLTEADVSKLRVAVLKSPPWDEADAETQHLIENFSGSLKEQGVSVKTLYLDEIVPRLMFLHQKISGYEFGRSIAFERVHHFDQLSEILRTGRLADGNDVSNSEYHEMIDELGMLKTELARRFEDMDVILFPSAPGAALKGLESTGVATFNSPWTLTGNPTVTLPLFKSSRSGLPIGCQLIGAYGRDAALLGISKLLERLHLSEKT